MSRYDKAKVKIIKPCERTKKLEEVCRRLWKNNFDDSTEYISFYFSDRWKESTTIIYGEESMLHLNPYRMQIFGSEKTIYYSVGVCTDKAYRHRGYMDALLRESFRYLYEKDAPFVYLMPADEKIYLPYDFTNVYTVNSFEIVSRNGERKNIDNKLLVAGYDEIAQNEIKAAVYAEMSSNEIEVIGYVELSEKQKSEFIIRSEKIMSEIFDCYVKRDEFYFEQKNREMKACGGELAVFVKAGKITGYVMYICEDNPETVETVIFDERDGTEKYIDALFEYSYRKGDMQKKGISKLKFDEAYFVDKILNDERNVKGGQKILKRQTFELLMARVINIKSFVKMFTTECEENMYVEIEDDFIEENNGKWNIHLGRKSMVTEYSEKNDTQSDFCDENRNDKYKKMTISQFGEHMLQKNKFYLNEMV